MTVNGGIRRRNPASGNLLYGNPLRFCVRRYYGSMLVVLPTVWIRFYWRRTSNIVTYSQMAWLTERSIEKQAPR